MKYFIIIDEQKDFNTGALANPANQKIVPAIAEMAKKKKEEGYVIIATRDTHSINYMETQEGKNLPVPHCIRGTPGWEVVDELKPFIDKYVDKPSFGYAYWIDILPIIPEAIEMCGTVTEICVVNNALMLKAIYPETPIAVHKDLCAGLSEEGHNAALTVMAASQIKIV